MSRGDFTLKTAYSLASQHAIQREGPYFHRIVVSTSRQDYILILVECDCPHDIQVGFQHPPSRPLSDRPGNLSLGIVVFYR